MELTRTFYAADRQTWRSWLEEHAAIEKEVWLVYYKQHTGRPSVTFQESLEEALCFGWVDSLIQKMDDDRYARKFTPRRPGSKWSEVNRRLVAKLVREGRTTEAGLARVDFPLPEPGVPPAPRKELPLPDWLKEGLMASPTAWENFTRLPPSHKRKYIGWISDAKREETRQRRIQEAIALLEQNQRLGIGPGEVRK